MSHFRKMLFAAAAVASFIGTSNTANAQGTNPFVCNTSFSPLVVRVEGLRELVGDIVITCTGGNSIGAPGTTPSTANQAVVRTGTTETGQTATLATGVQGNTATSTIGIGTPGSIGAPGLGAFTALTNPTVPAINISVTVAGTRITNRIFSGNLTDALLFIDEPINPASGTSTANQNPCLNTGTSIGTAGVCTTQNYFFVNGVAVGSGNPFVAATGSGTTLVPSTGGVPINVYQAQYGVGGGFAPNEQTITFVGVPIVQPGTFTGAGSRVYRIKNIRVQVANAFQVNGQIQAFISVQNPPANLVLNNAQGVVGFVQRGLFFDTVAGGPFAQCLGFNATSAGGFPTAGAGTLNSLIAVGALRFTEAYGVAFKRRGFGGVLDVYDPVFNQFYNPTAGQSNPSANYNNESGFYNNLFPTTNSLSSVGVASNGTRLRARFSGIPATVRLFVSAQPVTNFIGTATSCAATNRFATNAANTAGFCLGQGDSIGNAAFAYATTSTDGVGEGFTAAGTAAFVPLSSSSISAGIVQGSTAPGFGGNGAAYGSLNRLTVQYNQVPVAADGTGTYFWEVLRADDNVIDRFDFLVAAVFAPTTSIVTDANTSVVANVSGNFAPIAATGGNGYPSIPSFVLSTPEDLKPIFSITNCATNLLYPFVSSVTGFNTGIAVSNVSKDPFGTINETGICRVFFYGTTAGGGVDPTPQTFTKSVPSGQVATFNLLFGGPEYGVQPVVGFQGYIIISCNFRWAHGFAFVSDPSNLQTAHGYLALILDPVGIRRNTGAAAAEQLDN